MKVWVPVYHYLEADSYSTRHAARIGPVFTDLKRAEVFIKNNPGYKLYDAEMDTRSRSIAKT